MSLEDLQVSFKGLVSALGLMDVIPLALGMSVSVDRNLMMMMSMNLELMDPDEEMVNTLRIREFDGSCVFVLSNLIQIQRSHPYQSFPRHLISYTPPRAQVRRSCSIAL